MSTLIASIRKAKPETKDFPYKVGDDEFPITVMKFKPGTAAKLRKTAMIKLYRVVKAEAVPLDEMTQDTFDEQMDAQAERATELNEYFCKAVVDKKTGEKCLSIEDAEELFDSEFKQTCVTYAMGGATPPDPDNLTEEEDFSDSPAGSGE